MSGFLGNGAPFSADLNLVLQLAMGAALIGGFLLARRRRFRAHMYCQACVVLLNLVLIAVIMAPSFHGQIQSGIPSKLGTAFVGVTTLHAALGLIAELLGLYVVLVAATGLIPPRFRFHHFKPWMRTTIVLWWLVVMVGIVTYYEWYLAP